MGDSTEAFAQAAIAMGSYTNAIGLYSLAAGRRTDAIGQASTAMGQQTKAIGVVSTAMGLSTVALGIGAVSMGQNTMATGDLSTSIGLGNTARSFGSFVAGTYNDSIIASSPTTWNPTDPVFIVGNGIQDNMRSNAMVVLKNGSVGIGTSSPIATLQVNGSTILSTTTLGSLKLGTNGTTLAEMIKLTVNKNVVSVPANSTVTETFTVANAQLTSTVYISPASALTSGLIIAYARVSVAGTVEVKFTNTTGSAIDPAAMDFYITVIR
jgi:hypothetical protein